MVSSATQAIWGCCQLAWVASGLSFRGRRAAQGAPSTAASRAHPCGREAAGYAIWQRIRYLPCQHRATVALLTGHTDGLPLKMSEMMNRIRKRTNNTWAIHAEVPAIPVNPKIAAIMATTKKTNAYCNIIVPRREPMLNRSFAHCSRQFLKLDVYTKRRMLRAIYLHSRSMNAKKKGP